MSNSSFLNTFNDYSVEEFVQFLKNNGLSEFENLAIRKNIDGHTFLNLAEFEINNWKPIINSYQAQKFWSFLNQLKNAPMNFVFVAPTRPTVPAKPNVEKNKLEKLSQDSQFLVALRAAVKGRLGGSKSTTKSKSPPRDLVEDVEEPWPPPRPNYKKPVPPVPQYQESRSSDPEDPELLYEIPDDEEDSVITSTVPNQSRKLSPPVPNQSRELPPTVSKQSRELSPTVPKQSRELPIPKIQKPLPEIPVQLPANEPEEEAPVRRTPFKVQQHYIKQRKKEKELEKNGQNFSKISTPPKATVPKSEKIQPSKFLRETEPSKASNFEKSPLSDKRFNSIPRPPKNFPKLEINAEPSPNLSEISNPISSEQENFYRYTDRVGAEMLLSESFGDGTYLIRPSRQFHRTLSVRQGDKVYHLGIKKDGDSLEMESMEEGSIFDNLHELINHFKINPLVVRNKYNQLIDIYLRKTLPEDIT